MRSLDEEGELEAVLRYKLGMSAERIGALLGVHESTVRRALDRHGVERRPRQERQALTPGMVALLRGLGWTWDRIAEQTGASPTTVRNRYKEVDAEPEALG